jgi:hemolysin III
VALSNIKATLTSPSDIPPPAQGGLLYIAGALSYHRRWLNASPTVFGYHEVFLVYVCAAAACQYTGIALFIS